MESEKAVWLHGELEERRITLIESEIALGLTFLQTARIERGWDPPAVTTVLGLARTALETARRFWKDVRRIEPGRRQKIELLMQGLAGELAAFESEEEHCFLP